VWQASAKFTTLFSVKNGDPAGLGPRPAEPPERPRLSRARAAVLDAVEAAVGRTGTPATLAELTGTTGLHANTLREHLDALTRDGLVRRGPAPRNGRGRPAWRYSPAPAPAAPGAEYAGLAAALAASIRRTSATPVDDAVAAGTEWGHELARSAGRPADESHLAARRQVVAVLGAMGFEPHTDGAAALVRLTRCPLLAAARRYPDVVCGVHAGIARGALAEYDADDSGVALTAFAEPGACLLRLVPGEPR
jgi:predicted ArsR family transcriptional regulator